MNHDARFIDTITGLQVAQQYVQRFGDMEPCILDEALVRHAVASTWLLLVAYREGFFAGAGGLQAAAGSFGQTGQKIGASVGGLLQEWHEMSITTVFGETCKRSSFLYIVTQSRKATSQAKAGNTVDCMAHHHVQNLK